MLYENMYELIDYLLYWRDIYRKGEISQIEFLQIEFLKQNVLQNSPQTGLDVVVGSFRL